MRYLILVKATKESEAGALPHAAIMNEMAAYHEELGKAGVLLDCSGLKPTAKAWKVRYDGKRRKVIDGPFAEAKEIIAGYTLIQTQSREEAMEWVRRFPNPALDGGDGEIEVRELLELEDLASVGGVERFETIVKRLGR
jgi:hypothetical protein